MLRPDWFIQTKKNGVSVSFVEVLSKGKALGGRGVCLLQRPLGGSYQELTFTCDSVGSYLWHVLGGGASVNSRPLQVT